MQKSKIKNQKSKGFTLVELVVVLALFMVVIDVAVSIFINMVKYQKRVLEEQSFINQTSYVEEYMSKALRTAVKDDSGNCLFEGQIEYPGYIYLLTRYNIDKGFYEGVKFITSNNECKEFFLDSDGILKETKGGGASQDILSSKFTIEDVRFLVNGDKTLHGASQNDASQPRITFLIKVLVQGEGDFQEKIIQTTISQINLNTQ